MSPRAGRMKSAAFAAGAPWRISSALRLVEIYPREIAGSAPHRTSAPTPKGLCSAYGIPAGGCAVGRKFLCSENTSARVRSFPINPLAKKFLKRINRLSQSDKVIPGVIPGVIQHPLRRAYDALSRSAERRLSSPFSAAPTRRPAPRVSRNGETLGGGRRAPVLGCRVGASA